MISASVMKELNFSHLNDHKFRHKFNDTAVPMYTYGLELETTLYYLLCCNRAP